MSFDLTESKIISHPIFSTTDESIISSEIDECVEKIVHWAEDFYGQDAIIQAREDFFDSAGKVFHDDHFFHERMSLFLDYFIFERKLQKNEGDIPESPFEAFSQLHEPHITNFRHSMFEAAKATDTNLEIVDALTKERIKISPRGLQRFDGIQKKDMFQGFLYKVGDQNYLSHGLIFHPKDSWRMMRKEIKKWRSKSDMNSFVKDLYLWAKTNLKSVRHAHVSPKVIYKSVII